MEKRKVKFLFILILEIFSLNLNFVVSQEENPVTCFECGTNANNMTCGYSEGTEKVCDSNSAGCFIQLIQDSESDIPGYYTKRGCLNDLTEECTTPLCSSCTESNCNDGIYPLNRLSCLKCVDGDCKNGQIEQTCGVYVDSDDSCVTLFDDGGDVTFKGCYSDIADITKDICNDKTQIDCSLCTGGNCNTDTTRRGTKCFKCSGLECFQPKNPEDIVDCLSGCYIGLNENGENVRDCASSISNTANCGSLEEENACVVCEGDLCNSAIFPTERLACLTCIGNDCLLTNGKSTACSRVGSNEMCATIFAEDEDTVIERGCLSTLTNNEVCDKSDNSNCRTCGTKDCNVDSSKAVESKCVSCSSDKDPLCILDPTKSGSVSCASECYAKLLEIDPTTGVQHIERGCLSSTVVCNDPECEKCTGENCNQQSFPTDRISCHKCQGDTCSSNNIPTALCISYGQDQGCVTFFGDDAAVNYKNCYLDAPAATKEICDDSSQLSCSKCTGSNCNSDSTRRGNKCYECEGLECFNPNNPSDVVDCTSDCYVGLNSDGQNIRGCLSDLSDPTFCTDETKCKSCSGDYCNGIEYPIEGRLECLICSGTDCDESKESSLCSTFSENEKCVTVFDSTEDKVIGRGCSSQVDIKSSCDGSTNCRSCSDANCNNHQSKSDTEICIKCNSNDDVNCVNDASEITYCPSNVCYSRLLPTTQGDVGQHIERGCASDLPSNFECEIPTCDKCSGGKCNSGVFPSDRSKCFKCSGDEHCSQPHEEYCFMYTKDVHCVSVFKNVNETNYKNCYADSPPLTREVCDDDSQIDCVKCSGGSCNPITTTRLGNKCFKCNGIGCFTPNYPADIVDCKANCYVGMNEEGFTVRDCSDKVPNSGECATSVEDTDKKCLICVGDECNAFDYPPVTRLTCKSCVGDSCQTNNDNVQVCEKFNENETCVTIFDETADLVIERGCSSLVVGKSTCDSNSKNCLKCSTDECNIQTSKEEINECVSCSASDPLCITGSTSSSTSCKTDECYSRLVGDSGVERGCMTSEMTCVDPECTVCQGSNCNNGIFPEDRSSCHFCLNEECASENVPIPTKYCQKYVKDDNACITFYNRENNEVNYRNCYSDSPNGTQEVCDDKTQLDCTKCWGANCNADTERRGKVCYKCEGLSCFEVNDPADSVDCLSQCYIGLNENSETVRGCETDFQNLTSCGADDDGQHMCYVCADDYCNGISFPLNGRLKCHTCLGEDCNNILDNAEFCPVYDDPCVSVFEGSSGTLMERGCLSTLKNKMVCDENQYNCVECDTDACNIQMDPFNIQCVVCDSQTDPNCVINPSLSNQQKCLMGCYMKIDGVNIIRGCAEDLTEECSGDLCKICNETNSCNNEIDFPKPRLSCFKCEGSDCDVSGVDPPKEVCMNYHADDKCVVLFDKYALSKKACLSDLLDEEFANCSKDDPTCLKCSENNCNTAKIRDDEKCVICNSKDNRYCSTFPQVVPPSQCLESGDGKCYTWIDGVDTVRGCLSSLLERSCENKMDCEICEGSGCNKNDFPSDRQACYHCNQTDSDCKHKQEDESKIMPCTNYVKGDTCVEVLQDGIVIERGCGSDNFEICSTDPSSCKSYEKRGENKNSGAKLNVSLILLFVSMFILILRN